MIKTEKLTKVFRTEEVETFALNEVDIHIKEGEFVSVMGPSGCGKSTLLNILGLLDHSTGGSYLLKGTEVGGLKEKERSRFIRENIGFVFQSFNLLPYLTAEGNVEMPMIFAGKKPKERKERVRELLDRVGMADRAHHKPNEMSGGQQQRIAIARALANSPDIILADEPTGNLDTEAGQEIMKLLSDLHHSGKTIIMVTHEPEIAEHTRRIVRLQDGLVVSDKPVRQPRQASERAYARRARDLTNGNNGLES